jgi:hypothetical protein
MTHFKSVKLSSRMSIIIAIIRLIFSPFCLLIYNSFPIIISILDPLVDCYFRSSSANIFLLTIFILTVT